MFPSSNLSALALRIEKVVKEELRDRNSIGLDTELFNHATKGFEIDLAAFSIEEDEKEFTLPRNLFSQEESSKVYKHLIDASELEKILSKSLYHDYSITTTALILLSSGIQFHLLSVMKNLRRSHKLRTRLPDLKHEGSSAQKLDKINDSGIKVIKRLPAESKSSSMQQSNLKLKVDHINSLKPQVAVVYGPDIAVILQNEGLSQDLWNKSSLFPEENTTQDVLHAIEALGNSMFVDKVLQKFCLTKRLQIQPVN